MADILQHCILIIDICIAVMIFILGENTSMWVIC